MPEVITDATMMAWLQREMSIGVAKTATMASNLANLDTPGYHTREVTFSNVLEEQLEKTVPLASTHSSHITMTTPSDVPTREVAGLATRRDGNNVQLDQELLNGDADQFKQAATVMGAKMRLLRYAINEGR